MEGIKSTSIVWERRGDDVVDGGDDDASKEKAAALFCGEDDRFGTHREFILLEGRGVRRVSSAFRPPHRAPEMVYRTLTKL